LRTLDEPFRDLCNERFDKEIAMSGRWRFFLPALPLAGCQMSLELYDPDSESETRAAVRRTPINVDVVVDVVVDATMRRT
jgi:hypothetical protein